MITNNQSTPPSMYSRGGIDQQIQDGMNRAGNDPAKAKEAYGKSRDVKDLLVWQKLANTFKEIDKATALAGNGSPPTLMDSLPQEVMGRMAGKQNQGDRVQGVAGVLQNQQRQQQQMQGQPQGQPMRAAMGGIINAPAPNLNRMYNGGIVGYDEGGEIDKDAFRARVIALVKSGMSAEKATAQAKADMVGFFGRNKFGLRFPSEINKDRQGAKFLDREESRESRTAENKQLDRLNALSAEAIDRPQRQLGTTAMGMTVPPIQEDIVAPGPATVTSAVKEPVIKPEIKPEIKPGIKPEIKPGIKPEGIAGVFDKNAFDSTAYGAPRNKKEEDEELPTISGDDFTKQLAGVTTVDPETGKPTTREAFNQKVVDDKEQAQEDAFQAEANKPLSGSALIQQKLAAMGGKKGIAGLIELAANTNFRPSYGGTGAAFASAGRDIAETGRSEKARERKFLEGQLATQQAIEAAQVVAKEGTRQFDVGAELDEKTLAENARQANATLQERIDTRKQAASDFSRTFKQAGEQFSATLKQNGDYRDATTRINEGTLKLQELIEENSAVDSLNKAGELRAQTLLQAGEILRKLEVDYSALINEEVLDIMNAPSGEAQAAKRTRAEAHKETRKAELRKLRIGITGVVGGSGGAADPDGAFSMKKR